MEQKIRVNKTYRYFTYGNPEKASQIWFVLHGYGQLAYYFLRKFNILDPDEHFVVAPEGMHRFYLKGTSGRVGASWMTKDSRFDDIEDNHQFLDAVSNELLSSYSFEKKNLLGFSQGGATASRWHQRNTFGADNFILWGCVFPPDLEAAYEEEVFHTSKNYFVIGTKDEYFKDHLDKVIETYKSRIPNMNTRTFDGQHNIDSNTLKELASSL